MYYKDMVETTSIRKHALSNNGFVITKYIPNKNKSICIKNQNILEDEYKIDNNTGVIEFGERDVNKTIEVEYGAIVN